MKLERVTLKGFRCFGPDGSTITFEDSVTALVGANGAGKTALFQALSRLFGITASERRIQLQDFHLPADESSIETGATLFVDALLTFPELSNDETIGDAVPEFFRQMAASAPEKPLKARLVLKATWTDDGTPAGCIEEDVRWVRKLGAKYSWENDTQAASAVQRSTVQMIYVPAARDAQSQISMLLRGRLWQAAKWSKDFRKQAEEASQQLQQSFEGESPAKFVQERLTRRWKEVHDADTDSTPLVRLVDHQFEEFVRKANFTFVPDGSGQERSLAELSDGQRSLFHIALTAATLEVERDALASDPDDGPFDHERLKRTHLTLLAIEEPENSLSPFFLSRIIAQARDIGSDVCAQTILSSHSSAILSRIEPQEVRYFRKDNSTRCSDVKTISLPEDDAEANQFVRLAVRAYPELYFARVVILVEGDSERLVIPRVAEAKGIALDQSFVPIVPLGGRYCLHFWKLLRDLQIPFVTLLDFDIGRSHGGAKLLRNVIGYLAEIGVSVEDALAEVDDDADFEALENLSDEGLWCQYDENSWVRALEACDVFFSDPLDLDFSMLEAFPAAYKRPVVGGTGPRMDSQGVVSGKSRTLKAGGNATLYEGDGSGDLYDESFRWYPYLFLSRSKPETHLLALSQISEQKLRTSSPQELRRLVDRVNELLGDVGDVE